MDPAVLRDDMVDGLEYSLGRPLPDTVGDAMRTVPRREFVDAPYDNRPSEVDGTVALAPNTVARLVATLDPRPGDDVLVVGAGVGYTAAVVAEIVGAKRVQAVDIDRHMVYQARSNLSAAGYDAVLVDRRDGADGLPEYAPYDRILVEAAAVEPPRALVEQLADDGRLVFPRGATDQTLVAVERVDPDRGEGDGSEPDAARRFGPPATRTVDDRGPVRFAPLLVDGEQPGVTRNRTEREDREFADQGYFASPGWEQEWVDWDERLSGRDRRDGGPGSESGSDWDSGR